MIKRFCLLLALMTQALLAHGTDQNAIESAMMYAFAPPNFTLDIHFTNALDDPIMILTPGNVSITPTFEVASLQLLPGSRKGAQLKSD